MDAALLRFLIHRSRLGVLLAALGLCAFEFIMVGFYSKARPDEHMGPLLELLPEPIRAALGNDQVSIATPSGFLAMGFTHPVALMLLGTLALLTATRLAADIESRTIDLLLSQPLGRGRLLASHVAIGVLAALLAAAAAFAGHRLGVAVFPLPHEPRAVSFALAAVNLGLLVLAMHALGLLAAALSPRRATAVGASVGLLIFMLFLRLAAEQWEIFKLPAYGSFLTYYVPGGVIARGALDLHDVLVLLGLSAAGYLTAWGVFERRDLT
ncbi:MAG: ABC transporter permease subunit [Planctomycetes bacterium]|nr:ABC transporter permease subunit [Planctomycetota bacterium]